VAAALGLALAKISNDEDRNPTNVIKHGIGTDKDNINQWVEDIWETYDLNDDGNLDKREIKKFIDQTLAKINVHYPYDEFDLDDFFRDVDLTHSGMISRPELRNFFRKLGAKEPDLDLKEKLNIVDWFEEPKKMDILDENQEDDEDFEESESSHPTPTPASSLKKPKNNTPAIGEDDIEIGFQNDQPGTGRPLSEQNKLEVGGLDSDRKGLVENEEG
jgi:hypothetical protein